ncbi:hypothetical protein LRS10_14845 [Phenylobacterium sp. J426]|uniref:hypothetical protein n=1 Tax=Phenylobacterium sp. J426 TaxID=2898439 RepID=UPI002151DA93|nr:hypothetical protein [Phenylobacterium sp. J426]MCR5875346.1 hypothetical protein [Phenylobacterium sp. J426]
MRRVAPDLAALPAPWTIIGSGALMILGLPLDDCPDLDVLTTAGGAERLELLWQAWRERGYTPEPEAAFRSRFSRYSAPEGAIEVMGDLQLRTGAGWTPVEIRVTERRRFAGVDLPLPTAAEQLRILREFGRPKDLAKAARLEAWLAAG